MRDLVVDHGMPLAVRDLGGSGPAVVLLHGATRNLEDLMPLARRLRSTHRIVAMDFRNHGHSGHGDWDWPDLVGDVAVVIDELGLTDVGVVGHSLGGMVAALCAQVPGMLRAAVNLDGHGPGRPDMYVGMAPERVAQLLQRGRDLALTMLPGPMTSPQLDELCGAASAAGAAQGMAPDDVALTLRRSFRATGDGLFAFVPSPQEHRLTLDRVDALDLLASYRCAACPLLVVHAQDLPPDPQPAWLLELWRAQQVGLGRALDEAAAASPLLTVRHVAAGHGLINTHPDLVAGLVQEHLAGA